MDSRKIFVAKRYQITEVSLSLLVKTTKTRNKKKLKSSYFTLWVRFPKIPYFIYNKKYLWKSIVVSPYGEILHQCGTSEEIASLDIDLDEIIKERDKEPTFSEFEIEVYDKFVEHFKNEKIESCNRWKWKYFQ